MTNLRGPSNSLLFFKKLGGARLQVFKKTGGARAPPGPYGRYAYGCSIHIIETTSEDTVRFYYECLSVLPFPDAKGILRHKRTKGCIQKVKIFELAIATPAFRLRSVCVCVYYELALTRVKANCAGAGEV